MTELHVVIGAGPVGRTITDQLTADGHRVRVLTRSGSGHDDAERVAVDVRDEAALRPLLVGASAVYHCAHAAYTAKAWRTELPATEQGLLRAAADSVVVFPESMYSCTRLPATEDGPRDAVGGKRGVRTELLAARAASSTATVSVVASDYFGPYDRSAHASRMVSGVVAGSTVRVLGLADQPHSFTYLPDYARAMVTAARRPDLWNSVLHAPTGSAPTQRQLAEAFATAAGTTARVAEIPGWLMRVGALVPGALRELEEMRYQFMAPFVLSSTRSEAALALTPTPLDEATRATVAWWQQEPAPQSAA